MSDPFWDELNSSLPRAKRGEAGWAHQRSKVMGALRGGPAPRRGAARALAVGLAAAALLVALARRPAAPPAHVPSEDLEFFESAELLENLDELIDSPELDKA